MKQSALLLLLLPITAFAQKERFAYQPRRFQTSIRTGLFNSNLNAEFRLDSKTMVSVDFGIGLAYLHFDYYNRYNENYAEYDKRSSSFLNLGEGWWSLHTAIQVRRIVSSRSHIKYRTAPYANTFTYYALQLKRNGRELQSKGS